MNTHQFFATFGQDHYHNIRGTIYDKDCVVEIWAVDRAEAVSMMHRLFGAKYCNVYCDPQDMSFYPRGIVHLPGDHVKRPDEIALVQYLRPNGRKKIVFAPVGEEWIDKARGMVISSEVLMTGQVAIYIRLESEKEETESSRFATNGPGPDSPTEVLRAMIDEKFAVLKGWLDLGWANGIKEWPTPMVKRCRELGHKTDGEDRDPSRHGYETVTRCPICRYIYRVDSSG